MTASVTQDGVRVPATVAEPVVVSLNDAYLWSFTPGRDTEPAGATCLARWPGALAPYLHGAGHVRLSSVEGQTVWFDGVVDLGGEGRFEVLDASGRALSVDKVGHLARSFESDDDESRNLLLDITKRVLADLVEHAGVEAYLCYGALLGAVRNNGMLAHDSDTDVCYLSAYTHPADIIRESYRVERAMRARGWAVMRMSGADMKVFFTIPDGRRLQIDIFGAFYVEDTFYQLGNRNGFLDRSAISPTGTISVLGYEMPAPREPERMLAFLYGEGWRTPDPSFKYADNPAGVRRLDGWLRGYRDDMTGWSELWNTRAAGQVPTGPSDTFEWARSLIGGGDKVADVGAGNGRDAYAFVQAGHPVIALDARGGGVAHLNRLVTEHALEGHLEIGFVNFGELRSVLGWGARLAADPHHLYARDLLGCLTAEATEDFWHFAKAALKGTDKSLFLEFPAHAGERPPGPGRRVRLDPAAVAAAASAAGATAVTSDIVHGTDLFGAPDPNIARVQITWNDAGEKN